MDYEHLFFTRAEAKKLVGREILWHTPDPAMGDLKGKITDIKVFACPKCKAEHDVAVAMVYIYDPEIRKFLRREHKEYKGLIPMTKEDFQKEISVVQ